METTNNTASRIGRKRNQGSKWIRPVKRLAIYLRDGMACAYCGGCVETGAVLTLDHLVACQLGGSNSASNLVTCCLSCNSSKRDLPMRAWFTILRDRGINASKIGRRIRRAVKRDLTPFKAQAKAARANR